MPSTSRDTTSVQAIDAPAQRHKMVKEFAPETVNAYVAVLPNHTPLKDFFAQAGTNCVCLERFVYVTLRRTRTQTATTPHSDREIVYFTGDVIPANMSALKIRHRAGFRAEVRHSSVLILSVKGGRGLGLEDALEVVRMSPLNDYFSSISMVAVPPPKLGAPSKPVFHMYVQFCDAATARACVNLVDAMAYKGFYVHSPQQDVYGWERLKKIPGSEHHAWYNPLHRPTTQGPLVGTRSGASRTDSAASSSSSRSVRTPPSMVPLLDAFDDSQDEVEVEEDECAHEPEYSLDMLSAFFQ